MLRKLAVHLRHKLPGWVRDNAICSFNLVLLFERRTTQQPYLPGSLQLYRCCAPVVSGTVNGGKGMRGGVIYGQNAAVFIMENTC